MDEVARPVLTRRSPAKKKSRSHSSERGAVPEKHANSMVKVPSPPQRGKRVDEGQPLKRRIEIKRLDLEKLK